MPTETPIDIFRGNGKRVDIAKREHMLGFFPDYKIYENGVYKGSYEDYDRAVKDAEKRTGSR